MSEIRRLIEEAGRIPIERDTLYREVVRDQVNWHTGRDITSLPVTAAG